MLELKHIHFETPDEGKVILRDVSLTVSDKQFVVITGPNGGGKSTLARIIMGVERPTSGQILFDGTDITDLDVTERAKLGIGFAFQQPVRFKGITVRDLIELAAGRSLTAEEACTYLSEVGLCALDYVGRQVSGNLSGGELKRIEIATLMARSVALSIFDEPEAGIDLWSFHNLIKVFEKLRDATKGSIIIISHQERILEIADRIVVVVDGAVAQEDRRADILPGLLSGTDSCNFYREAMA